MDPKKNRPFRLRTRTLEDLQTSLTEHRKELTNLRISKVTSAVASKIAKIKVIRKGIARLLTIINEKRRANFKKTFSSRAEIKKFNDENKTSFTLNRKPKLLRPRKTRAMRRALTQHQEEKKLLKIVKRERAFPERKFFVKA